jgi:hypothetical protein
MFAPVRFRTFPFLSKNIQIQVYKDIILMYILGVGLEKDILSGSKALSRIFGPTREEVTGGKEKYTLGSFIITLFTEYCYWGAQTKEDKMGGVCTER